VSIDGVTVPGVTGTLFNGMIVASFPMPAFTVGTHTISVSDSNGAPVNTATSTVSVAASSVTITPNSGNVGATGLVVTGSGFKAGEVITVKIDATPLAAATTGLTVFNTNGQILLYTGVTIAAAGNIVAGAHTISLTGTSGAIATATFTIQPKLTLTPSAVRAGSVSVVSATGFSAASAVSVTLNGTATTWFNTVGFANTTTIITTAAGLIPSIGGDGGLVIVATTVPQALNVTVTDALGFAASATLTVLGTPAITLSANQTVIGVTVTISGTGFSPTVGARPATAQLFSGTTLVQIIVLTPPSTVNPGPTGSFTAGASFVVPTLAAGTYIIGLTVATPPATESANATFTILGAPTVTATPTLTKVGGNVTLQVVGLVGPINIATLGGTLADLIALANFGPTTVPSTGANAYNLTTWFIAPTLPAAAYTLLIGDGTRSATTTVNITSTITLAQTSGLKGSPVTLTGTGFAASSPTFTVTFNGAAVTLTAAGVIGATGLLTGPPAFIVPVTATANNTVTVTDASGNAATAYFAITTPTLTLGAASGSAGSTVQVIGSGFTASIPATSIFVQVGGAVVTTIPTPVLGPAFIVYVVIPTGTATGTTTITAIDAYNNAASANFTVTSGGTGGAVVNQAALSSTAQSVNPSTGAAQTSFARGTSVKLTFVLDTTTGSTNVVWGITLQQPDLTVTGLFTTTASISTTPSPLSSTTLISGTAQAGTWTATIQIFASDGVTPLAVTTVTFNVT